MNINLYTSEFAEFLPFYSLHFININFNLVLFISISSILARVCVIDSGLAWPWKHLDKEGCSILNNKLHTSIPLHQICTESGIKKITSVIDIKNVLILTMILQLGRGSKQNHLTRMTNKNLCSCILYTSRWYISNLTAHKLHFQPFNSKLHLKLSQQCGKAHYRYCLPRFSYPFISFF